MFSIQMTGRTRLRKSGFGLMQDDFAGTSSSYLLLVRQLSVLMTTDYELLVPEEAMVLSAVNRSTAKRVVDPASTLLGLDHQKMRDRTNYLIRDWKTGPPK